MKRTFKILRSQSGFSLAELVTVISVITLLLNIIVPSIKGMQDDMMATKADEELRTIKTALISYWRNHEYQYPPDIHTSLHNATPKIALPDIHDPWNTDSVNNTYGYVLGFDYGYGQYFAIYTKGPEGDTAPVWDPVGKLFTYTGSGRVIGNAMISQY